MKAKSTWLIAVLVVLILAGGLFYRLNFLLNYHQAPVVWDAAGYNIQAHTFASAFSAWPDRAKFMEHFKKAYEMALPKCELYPLFVSLVYLVQGLDHQAVRIAQALLSTLGFLILYLIAVRVGGRRVGLITLLIAAFYPPFVISEGRLLTETLAIFVFLLTVWLLVLALDRGSWWLILLSGISTALMLITRTFFQYVYIFYYPLLLAGLWLKKSRDLRAAPPTGGKSSGRLSRLVRSFPGKNFLFILGLAIIIVPRLFWTPQVDRQQRRFISGSWRNGLAMYCGIYPPNQGLQTTSDPGGDILRSIRSGSADERYLKAYFQILLRRPLEAIQVILAKARLFCLRAYNDFLQYYLIPPSGMDLVNRVILLAGLFGILLLLGRGPRTWPVLVSLVYGWAMCFAADAEARYTITQLPLTILVGVLFAERAVVGLSAGFSRRSGRVRLLLPGLVSGLLGLFALLAQPRFLLLLFSRLAFPTAFYLRSALVSVFFLSLIPLLAVIYRVSLSGWRRKAAAALPPVFLLLVYLSALQVHPTWHQWSVRLQGGEQVVRQTIELPASLENYRSAELKLDLLSSPERWYDLTVSVDGEVVRRFEGGLSPDQDSWVPPVIRRAFPTYLRETRRQLGDLPQWYTIPLDLRKLAGRKSLQVEIRFIPRAGGNSGYVDLFGDYQMFQDPQIFEGPTLSKSPSKLSIYKYLVDDDWRIWERVPVAPVTRAEYLGPGKSREEDLSPAPGLQTGAFRVFLSLWERKAPPSGFPVAVRREDYLTRKSILADYYNLQIWEVNPWKRKSNHFQLAAAHAAPGEEGGFRLVVYADTDRDKKPDRLVAESPYFTVQSEGGWSSYTFATEEESIYVGMSWPRGSKTRVYYERALWPDDLFPETMVYRPGPSGAIAAPVLTNLRLIFLEEDEAVISDQ